MNDFSFVAFAGPAVFLIANGFLPTRASWILDAIFVAMFAICLVMLISIVLVRFKRKFRTHRAIQIGLSVVLVLAIVVFEIDMRLVTDWRELAEESVFYHSGWVDRALWVHLMFAIPTPLVWGWVVVQAIRRFGDLSDLENDARAYRVHHRRWGRLAAGLMSMTATTGCIFYWLAFVC